MTDKIRLLILSSLSLALIGGIFAPTVVQAATTEPSSSTTSDSSKDTTTHFNSFESPYNSIIDEKGNLVKDYWYPTASSQIYTSNEVQTDGFTSNFATIMDFHPSGSEDAADLMLSFAQNGLQADPSESLAQYLFSVEPEDSFLGSGTHFANAAAFAKCYALTSYFYAWAISIAAQQDLGTDDYATAKSEYKTTIRPMLLEISSLSNCTDETNNNFYHHLDETFSNTDGFTYNTGFARYLRQSSKFHIDTYSTEERAKLNPAATAEKNTELLAQPLSSFIQKQDGNVMADGVLSAQLIGGPLAYVFGKQPTQPTTPSITSTPSAPVTIHYVDEQGNTLKPDKTLTGSFGDSYKAELLTINGYKLTKTTGQESGTFTSSDQSITYTYRKITTDPVIKNHIIYSTKKINLYASPTFTKKAIEATYAKAARTNRPMFKILGIATSKNGTQRYKVIDLNGKGITGYITTKAGYIASLYYRTKPKRITVINPSGLDAYPKRNLTGKKTHYKQGQTFRVKKIVSHNLTTRFLLSNGTYISADKKLVTTNKEATTKRIVTKTAINRYGTANLTKKNKHIAKGTTLKVTGWAYSNTNNFRKGDTLRYKVAGGYITANSRFIQTIK